MKILVIGGIARSLLNFRGDLLKDMLREGHEVHTAAGETSEEDKINLQSIGVRHHALNLSRASIDIISDAKIFISIWKLCREIHPNLVFCYTIKPATIGVLSSSLVGANRICVMITGLGYAFENDKSIIAYIAALLYKISLSRCNVVIFQNKDNEKYFRKRHILSKASNVQIVNGSGVNTDYFDYSAPRQDPLSFLMICRLLRTKGVNEYVSAACEVKKVYPQALFYLIGDVDSNPNSISIEQVEMWNKEGIVNYLGPKTDVRPWLRDCSVYVLPSYNEGLPRTILEAMSIGRPIITTDVPGCRDTIEFDTASKKSASIEYKGNKIKKGSNGLLVPARNVEALVAAILYLIENPDERETMGLRSRELACSKFDVKKVNAKMKEYLGY
jgi:glycosyltransferase involved in cell wall biosynthesis